MGRLLLEKYIQAVRMSGLNTNKNAYFGGNVTIVGTLTAPTQVTGSETITSTSANALAVGPAGTTNPTFNVDASTASAATGLLVTSAAAGSGVTLSVSSSGSNERMIIKGKGTTGLDLLSVSGGSNLGAVNIGTQSSAALSVGGTGNTNPAFRVVTGSGVGTGVSITSALAGSGVAIGTLSSGTNENLTIDAKGSGTITIAGTSTGTVGFGAGITSNAFVTARLNVAMPAGGSVIGFGMSSTSGFGIFFGSGAPTVSAAQGSIYLRSDGSSTSTRLYVNSSSGSGTTWTNVTTAA